VVLPFTLHKSRSDMAQIFVNGRQDPTQRHGIGLRQGRGQIIEERRTERGGSHPPDITLSSESLNRSKDF
jgi:hypothetical protein